MGNISLPFPIPTNSFVLTFDGAASVLDLSAIVTDELIGTYPNGLTFAAWVQPITATGSTMVFAHRADAGNPFWMLRKDTSGFWHGMVKDEATTVITLISTSAVVLSEWVHVALVSTWAGTSVLYINGSAEDTDTTPTGSTISCTRSLLGGMDAGAVSQFFQGNMTNVVLAPFAATAPQIAVLAKYQPAKMLPGSTLLYTDSETDRSGNGNDATVEGAITIGVG